MSDKGLLDGKRVLVVDDEPDILEVVEQLLPMCHVTRASSFSEAEKVLESKEFDLAVLDIMGVDGYHLLEIARKKNIPTAMLTAHALSPGNVVKSIQEGADSYIPKDKISDIQAFLIDILQAKQKGKNPWARWDDRLPSSYFAQRWGAAWQDADKEFWGTFRESIKTRSSPSKKEDP